jgi:hypothetical protein
MDINSPNKRATRKRSLNNKHIPNAKRSRTVRSLRFSDKNHIRNINREGRSAPVVHQPRLGRELGAVVPRSEEQTKRAENVAWLSANVSSRHDQFDDMAQNVIRQGTTKGLSRNTIEQTIGHLYRIYSKYQKNLNAL